MKILPYRRFTIETPLAPAEVHARLRAGVEPPRLRAFSLPERPLVGRVDGDSFDVMRAVMGRNSFRPRVRGTIQASGKGTRLSGTMQVHEVVLLFVGAFLLVAGSVFVSQAAASIASRQLEPAMLVALGVILFLTVMTLGGFLRETRPALDDLGRLVDASHAELR